MYWVCVSRLIGIRGLQGFFYHYNSELFSPAQVAKLVDAGDSKSPAERCVGSSPTLGTTNRFHAVIFCLILSNYINQAIIFKRLSVVFNVSCYLIQSNLSRLNQPF